MRLICRHRSCCIFFAICGWCGVAAAHALGEHAAHSSFSDWSVWEQVPWLAALMLCVLALYATGVFRLHRRGVLVRALGAARIASFAVGWIALWIALASSFDVLADGLFCAHMTQHLILMIVAPPLLVHSRPGAVFMWALPLRWRRGLARWWNRSTGCKFACHFAARPLPSWTIASVTLWFWHVPALYDWALRNETVHVVEHVSFFATSLLYWHASRGRKRSGAALVSVALFALHSGLLGALLTFASHPLYPLQHADDYGLTALQDQQLAGLIMWIPMGLVYLCAFALLFVRWMDRVPQRLPMGSMARGLGGNVLTEKAR